MTVRRLDNLYDGLGEERNVRARVLGDVNHDFIRPYVGEDYPESDGEEYNSMDHYFELSDADRVNSAPLSFPAVLTVDSSLRNLRF
jgi:hypothetical protein